jgi:tRNA-2-methylthio-N6-dimethylallyladenosine synthase
MPRTFLIRTFGCQMNRHDAEALAGLLERAGLAPTEDESAADVILFETCSVRAHAEERVYSLLGRLKPLKRRRPELVIGVIGCMAEKDREGIFRRAPHVDFAVGPGRLDEIPDLVQSLLIPSPLEGEGKGEGFGPGAHPSPPPSPARGEGDKEESAPAPRTFDCAPLVLVGRKAAFDLPSSLSDRREHPWSAYLAISRGCSCRCAYCVVPSVRGELVSRLPEEILAEAEALVGAGATEIVLLGQNADAYGRDLAHHQDTKAPSGILAESPRPTAQTQENALCLGALVVKSPRPSLAGLVREVGKLESRGLRRLSFVTSHPRDISEELLRAMAETPVVAPYLHMPAQSGSDRVLAAMRRGYTAGRYREIVALARGLVPGAEIASDFIVGFPGETEEDYLATEQLVRELEFQQIFVFKYSPRPGTLAAERLADDVPAEVKKERNNRLLDVQRAISLRLNRALVGRSFEVLVEGASPRDERRLAGRTRTGRIAVFPRDERVRPGDYANVRIVSATALTLVGELA